MIDNTPSFWIIFNLAILLLILIDLKLFRTKGNEVSVNEALVLTAFWIGLALLFNFAIYWTRGLKDGLDFLSGYLIEYSLSVDNLFVFLLIFTSFKVPPHYVHKVLFWGILGAIVLRALFILCGIALIHKFSWIIYIFGVFLIYTGFKLAFSKETEVDPETNFALRIFKHFFPVTKGYVGDKFFTKINGKTFATPLAVVLFAVEATDVVFALDSIPAILGITTDVVIVYTSNIFAVLGLRSLYFALAGMLKLFHYLHYGLAVILTFIGLKTLLSGYLHLPVEVTLGFIFVVLAGSVGMSMVGRDKGSQP
jgi:tellurite resistance protein TerC